MTMLRYLSAEDEWKIAELRSSGDNPEQLRPIKVHLSGGNASEEYFHQCLLETGWDVVQVEGNSIWVEWWSKATDDELNVLCDRVRKLLSSNGLRYHGWSVPLC